MNNYLNERLQKLAAQRKPHPTVTRQPAGQRPAVPPYQPFPVGALPDGLREFVVELAAAIGCDPVFVALPALTLASAAIGNSLVARATNTWTETAVLWCCVVADSGTGKSPALKLIVRIALDIQRRLREEHQAALRKYKQDHEAWKKATDPDPGREPVKPVRPHFAVMDITIEKLIVTASESPHGLLMVRDELAGWFESFRRYRSKGGGSDASNWLSMYDAGPTSYQRRTGSPAEVEADHTFVSVCGGIQPAILKAHLADPAHEESGLAARLLFAMPPKACLRWTDADLPHATEARFRRLVGGLFDLPFDPRSGPTAVRLDAAASGILRELKDEYAETAEALDGGPLSKVLPKATGQAVRLALIHHAVTEAAAGRDPGKGCIGAGAMAAGVELVRWFVHEAGRVHAMLAESDEDRADRALCGLIARKGGRISVRELQLCNRPGCKTADECRLQLDALVAAGRGEWRPAGGSGGRCRARMAAAPAGVSCCLRPAVARHSTLALAESDPPGMPGSVPPCRVMSCRTTAGVPRIMSVECRVPY